MINVRIKVDFAGTKKLIITICLLKFQLMVQIFFSNWNKNQLVDFIIMKNVD